MNLIDRYLNECIHNRKYNWMINNIYISVDQHFSPTSSQQEIILTRDNKKAFLLPRRSGATTLICADAIAEAMLTPLSEIIVFSPHQSSCRYTSQKLREILNYSSIHTTHASNDRVEFENGSYILFRTGNESFYVGRRPRVIYIDNFDMFNSVDLSNMFNRLMYHTEHILILGNNVNDYETQRMININPREL